MTRPGVLPYESARSRVGGTQQRIASYYPIDPRTSLCRGEDGGLGGEWIGQGAATCRQTMDCLKQAAGVLAASTGCMLAASPSVSRESSELCRCLFTAEGAADRMGPKLEACAAH